MGYMNETSISRDRQQTPLAAVVVADAQGIGVPVPSGHIGP
jgi:hypothetical protein